MMKPISNWVQLERISGKTNYGYSGSTVSTLKAFQFGNSNRGKVTLHSSNDLPSFASDWSLNLDHQRQQSGTWPDGLISRDSRRPKPTSTSGRNSQGSLGKRQFGSYSSRRSTHSSCGLDYGAVKWLKKDKTSSSVQNKARLLALACTIYSL
ncbi:hypothetical protein Salat_1057500 [Sesamum alatum]|uniref:Uncharacterized protein n=1 Tax=Sesamum alatum TaxID=300844 RepID=A0AAE1YNC4_9LAMI|nr:hypothetical protein Salat_1057500 [Sesamum alatum]